MKIREPFFAHQGWYPLKERDCRSAVEQYLKHAGAEQAPLGGVVPHAGWFFSGAVAGRTFAALAKQKPQVIFVFGGHLRPHDGCILMTEGAFGTPLGPVPVAEELAQEAAEKFRCHVEYPDDFRPDNTIELQMPFIRHIWPEVPVVAMQVPPTSQAEQIGRWAARLCAEKKLSALAIGSTDLTHYGANYGFMPRGTGEQALRWSKEENDRPFLEKLLQFDCRGAIEHALTNHSACCPGAAAAAVAFCREAGAEAGRLLEHTTSAEVEGRERPTMWVGYASLVF